MKQKPEDIFRKHGGRLRMSEALARGITRYMLYALRDKGVIEQVSRGVWRLVDLPPIGNPDLVTVSLRFPNAVICLVIGAGLARSHDPGAPRSFRGGRPGFSATCARISSYSLPSVLQRSLQGRH